MNINQNESAANETKLGLSIENVQNSNEIYTKQNENIFDSSFVCKSEEIYDENLESKSRINENEIIVTIKSEGEPEAGDHVAGHGSIANVQNSNEIHTKLNENIFDSSFVCKSKEIYDENLKSESRINENEIIVTIKSEGEPEAEDHVAGHDSLSNDDNEEIKQLSIGHKIFCLSLMQNLSGENQITTSTKKLLEENNDKIREIEVNQNCFPPPAVNKSTPTRATEPFTTIGFEESMRRQMQFDTNVFNYFLKSFTPFNFVESPEFLTMFQRSNIEMTRISEEHLSTIIEIKFKKVKNKIITLLDGVDFVCIAIDLWLSKSHSYLAITCHWIDAVNFKRRSVALACKRLDSLSEIYGTEKHLKRTLKNYNLPKHKITSNVTENFYNFNKLFRELNIRTTISKTDTIDDSYSLQCEITENMDEVPYICYTKELSLIATMDIQDVINSYPSLDNTYEFIFKKVFSFLFLASSDDKLAPLLADLKKPNIVKWNSIYNAIAYFLKLEEKHSLAELFELLEIEPLNDEEVDYIRQYINSLAPLASAFERLQCEQGSYHGVILPTLLEMRKKCDKILDNNDLCKFRPFLHTVISKSSERFYDFFTSSPKSDSIVIASVSHPQFKEKWVSAIVGLKVSTVTEIFMQTVINENSKSNDARKKDVQVEKKGEEKIDDFYFGEIEEHRKKNKRTKLSFEVEALKYLEDDRRNLKMLDDYPAVKRVFLKYNTSLSSSEPVEKLFPYETRQNIARYGYLGEKYFEERVLFMVNKDVLDW